MFAKKVIVFSVLISVLRAQSGETIVKPVVESGNDNLNRPLEQPVVLPGVVLPEAKAEQNVTETKLNETNTPAPSGETTVPPKKYMNQPDEQWEPEGCKCLAERYLVHYEEKGCKEVKSELFCKKPCPKYFECPPKADEEMGCEYKGRLFRNREAVPVDHPCKKGCYCDSRWSRDANCTKSQITCAYVECPSEFRPPEHNPNCVYVYEEGMCCPKRKCINSLEAPGFICKYNGIPYRFGQKIYPKEDPCIECICEHGWDPLNPLSSAGCRKVKCDLQLNPHFKAGCLPIYHEKACCPIDYYCPPPEEQMCKFLGKNYLIGETVDIKRDKTECKCLVPPELTCIEKS